MICPWTGLELRWHRGIGWVGCNNVIIAATLKDEVFTAKKIVRGTGAWSVLRDKNECADRGVDKAWARALAGYLNAVDAGVYGRRVWYTSESDSF